MRAALGLWICVVILLSLQPLRFKLALGTTGPYHSLGHFGVFLITMLMAGWRVRPRTNQISRGALVILFGLVLEISEVVFYHNELEWHDVLVDALGVFTGLLLLKIIHSRHESTAAEEPIEPR